MKAWKVMIYKHDIDNSIDRLLVKEVHINDVNKLYREEKTYEDGYTIVSLYNEDKKTSDLLLAKMFQAMSIESEDFDFDKIARPVLRKLKSCYEIVEKRNPELLV